MDAWQVLFQMEDSAINYYDRWKIIKQGGRVIDIRYNYMVSTEGVYYCKMITASKGDEVVNNLQ